MITAHKVNCFKTSQKNIHTLEYTFYFYSTYLREILYYTYKIWLKSQQILPTKQGSTQVL